MAQLLLKESCTVTIGHSKTKDLTKSLCKNADIIVAAVGKAEDGQQENGLKMGL